MSRHTEGEWEVNDLEDGSGEIVVWEYDIEGEVCGSTVVVPAIYLDDEEARSNANLICASSDMLHALKSARALWGDYLPPGNSNAMKAMRLVDAAITKATINQ